MTFQIDNDGISPDQIALLLGAIINEFGVEDELIIHKAELTMAPRVAITELENVYVIAREYDAD